MTRAAEACPCGRPLPYDRCCGRWHAGATRLQAPDAESLMRSRYSAFVRELDGYLLDTWHASTRPPAIDFEPGLRWLARSKLGGRAHRLHETSRFVREDGRWFYVDALPLS